MTYAADVDSASIVQTYTGRVAHNGVRVIAEQTATITIVGSPNAVERAVRAVAAALGEEPRDRPRDTDPTIPDTLKG
jgi:hypothetical protein